MKVLIVGFAKIKYMPYLNLYLDNLNFNKNKVHLLYWDRDKSEDMVINQDITLHKFSALQQDDVKKSSKIKSFLKFRKYAKKVIKSGKYDFIIILHTLPGILLLNLLKRKYKGKYLLDYRDSTYERFFLFRKLVHSLSINAKMTFVSSNAFKKYLPKKANIFTTHNLIKEDLNNREYQREPSSKIRIAFWGFIRHEAINREIIKKIASDNRFELHYYGRQQQIANNLKFFAQELNADNIFFHGEYKPTDRYDFVKNTDIIHNIYKDNNTMLAMGNKYYDGVIFRMPQLCMSGSYMAKMINKAGIGLECSPYDDDFCDKIASYYSQLQRDDFLLNCDEELNRILIEHSVVCEKIQSIG